jgi:hypothetical protein
MQPQPYVRFDPPVSLCLTLPSATRARVAADEATADTWQEFAALPLHVHMDALARTLTAYLSPIPKGIVLYGQEDFAAACADSMEDHVSQVLRILGDMPAAALQMLIDGDELPDTPQRVPREVANWRIKFILDRRGVVGRVQPMIDALPEPARTAANYAWNGDAKIARTSAMAQAIAQELGLDMNEVFIEADAIPT